MLLVVRHGEAVGNVERRFIGQLDTPLSPLGERQAQWAASRLATLDVERIVSSDLQRALATAKALGDLTGMEVEVDPRVREVSNGDWTNLVPEEIGERWPEMLEEYRSGVDVARPNGERWADVRARVVPAVEELLSDGRRTALFTHGGPVLIVAAWASGVEVRGNVFAGPIAAATNASITTILPGPRLAAYNDTGHLGESFDDPSGPMG